MKNNNVLSQPCRPTISNTNRSKSMKTTCKIRTRNEIALRWIENIPQAQDAPRRTRLAPRQCFSRTLSLALVYIALNHSFVFGYLVENRSSKKISSFSYKRERTVRAACSTPDNKVVSADFHSSLKIGDCRTHASISNAAGNTLYPQSTTDKGQFEVTDTLQISSDESQRDNDNCSERISTEDASLRNLQILLRARSSLLFGRSGTRSRSQNKRIMRNVQNYTLMSDHRVGDAEKAKHRAKRCTSVDIFNVLQKSARVLPSIGTATSKNMPNISSLVLHSTFSSRVTNTVVKSVIENIFKRSSVPPSNSLLETGMICPKMNTGTAAFASYEPLFIEDNAVSPLSPGSLLLPASDPVTDPIAVSIATTSDDTRVANLRLSVFSDFPFEMQHQFHARSCQLLQSRRLRGSLCLMATCPIVGYGVGGDIVSKDGAYVGVDKIRLASNEGVSSNLPTMVIGSAECSFHEFFGTRLGQSRPQCSLLYVTEVAVHESVRRMGVGRKLLQAVDRVAALRGSETLYLHVETLNEAALKLYERAGFRRVDLDRSPAAEMDYHDEFCDFTRSLHLQSGATKGRDHFLLCKDYVPVPTWLETQKQTISVVQPSERALGFEVPV